MRTELLYNPFLIIERIAISIYRQNRFNKLKNTPAKNLTLGHIDSLELLELIKEEVEVKVIYDIGANIGTWTLLAKAIFPNSRIFAFEPLISHIDKFKSLTQGLKDIILYPLAVGSSNEYSKINIASFSDASSILKSTELLEKEHNISTVNKVGIEIVKLDDFIEKETVMEIPDVIKLDIQGYELEALRGCIKVLKATKYVIMEVSFLEYYKEQPLFEEVIVFMSQNNFRVKAFGENTPRGKNLSQIDILFYNTIL